MHSTQRGALSAAAIAATLSAAAFGAGDAHAGGFSREPLNSTGLLFSNDAFVAQGQLIRVWPERTYSSAQNGYPFSGGATITKADANPEYVTGSLAVKARLFDGFDCMARLHQPYGQATRLGPGWVAGNQFIEQNIDARGIDGTCSYTFALTEEANLRLLGGVRGSTFDYERVIGLPGSSLNRFSLDSDVSFGWRAGISYERPAIAMRATLTYTSPIEYDLSGVQQINGVGTGLNVTSTAEMPQTVELRLQSGVAPDWLASLGVRWEEWGAFSALDVDHVVLSSTAVNVSSSTPTQFGDTWTVEAGVGHKLSDKWGVGGSLTWSQGAGGGYSDTWTLGAAVAYDPVDNVRIELSGGVSRLTADKVSGNDLGGGTYSYDQDGTWAFATGLRLRFSY